MGCSASRPITFPSRNPDSPSPSPFSSSSSSATGVAMADSSCSSPPVPQAFSLPTPLIHHPPLRKGDTHHLVSLTSTTYGSLLLIDRPKSNGCKFNGGDHSGEFQPPPYDSKPANPADSEHTLSPDSVINTWELMDGLDDLDSNSDAIAKPDLAIAFPNKPRSSQYMGFDGSTKTLFETVESAKCSEKMENTHSPSPSPSPSSSVKPLWQHLSEEALLAKLDPEVVFSYRRALSSRQLGSNSHRKTVKSVGSTPQSCSFSNSWFRLPGAEDNVVIYFTSLRGIRKTYEDCCSIRTIFWGFRVPVDERDISMDSSYRKELQTALGGKTASLPQVFIRGKYIGGAEEIKQLNEYGELAKLLVGFPVSDFRSECERCGDARFLPCLNCYGSRKVFEEEEGELRRCPDCNENGLIKCPECCS